jgi:very-short-patch-repair endonuclease
MEVDGGWLMRRGGADQRCDRKLARLGYRVLRLDAELVLRDLPSSSSQVCAALGESL